MTHPIYNKKCPYCTIGECKYCFGTRLVAGPKPTRKPRVKPA